TRVPGSWAGVSASTFAACGIDSKKELWCWGGFGDTHGPDEIVNTKEFASLGTGAENLCALDTKGVAWCWSGDYTSGSAPVELFGYAWKAIASTDGHACGIAADGSLSCWGTNTHGELGTGATSMQEPDPVPVQ